MASNKDSSTEQSMFNECFDIVKSSKTVTVPCCKNIQEAYTVKVPKTKTFKVDKQVPYIDYERRTQQVPYQYFEKRTVIMNVPTCRTIPTIKNVCTIIPVKRGKLAGLFSRGPSCVQKKCPRTVYVTKTCCEPRQFCQSIPRTGLTNVQRNVPVQKFRMQTELKHTTEHVPEVRYRSRKVSKLVSKTVPVYKLVPKTPAQPVKESLLHTVPEVEKKAAKPTFTRARSEPIHSTVIPFHSVDAKQYAMYNTGYYVPRTADANIGYKIPAQYGNRYNVYGPSKALATDTKARYTSWDGTWGYQEETFDPTNTNGGLVSNIVEHGRDYSKNNERYNKGYQAQSRVHYQPIGVRGVPANFDGVGAEVDLGRQRF